jgi:hypothetical protein
MKAVRRSPQSRKSPAVEEQQPALAHDLNNDVAIMLAECESLDGLLAGDSAALVRLNVITTAVRKIADRIAHTFPKEVKTVSSSH